MKRVWPYINPASLVVQKRIKSTYSCLKELNTVRLENNMDAEIVDVDHDNYTVPIFGRHGGHGGISIGTHPMCHKHSSNSLKHWFHRELRVDCPIYGPRHWGVSELPDFIVTVCQLVSWTRQAIIRRVTVYILIITRTMDLLCHFFRSNLWMSTSTL